MAPWPLVSIISGQLSISLPFSITFLYPRLNLRCLPPLDSIKSVRASEVTESVTTVPPGESLSVIADIAAISLFLLKAMPLESTTADRSTSVSKMTPRSALDSETARWMLRMASASSGLGTWLGNMPSGSRNWEPETSAPRGSRTSLAKNPPAPLPASTTIFRPARGASPAPTSAMMWLRRIEA